MCIDLTRRPEVTWDPEVNLFQDPFGLATVRIPLPERAVDRSDGISAGVWIEDQWRWILSEKPDRIGGCDRSDVGTFE